MKNKKVQILEFGSSDSLSVKFISKTVIDERNLWTYYQKVSTQ